MITPFGPPNDDLDRLNTILDAQVTGKRAPETDPASDTDALAATAHLVSGQSIDAREDASPGTLDSIWRNVMYADALSGSTMVTGSLPGAIRSRDRDRGGRGPESSMSSSWVSVAAVAVLLFGIVGGAWAMRQGNGGGDEPLRLAAVVPQETPEASPAGDSEWLAWVTPEECTVEPMTTEEYAKVLREAPDISGRSYDVVGPAAPETAEAVASAARAHEACLNFGNYDQVRVLESPAFIFYRNVSIDNPLSADEKHALDTEHGRKLSGQVPERTPADYAILKEDPPEAIKTKVLNADPTLGIPFFYAYDPDQAMALEDGRVAIPAISLYRADRQWIYPPEKEDIDAATDFATFMLILSDESGEWKLDEQLLYCLGVDCDAFWADRSARPGIIDLPAATPIATPER